MISLICCAILIGFGLYFYVPTSQSPTPLPAEKMPQSELNFGAITRDKAFSIEKQVDFTKTGDFLSIRDLARYIERYRLLNGKYPHVQKKEMLEGRILPEGFVVNEYETPDGQYGYELQYETDTTLQSWGFGPQAAKRTFIKNKPIPVASSTLFN